MKLLLMMMMMMIVMIMMVWDDVEGFYCERSVCQSTHSYS